MHILHHLLYSPEWFASMKISHMHYLSIFVCNNNSVTFLVFKHIHCGALESRPDCTDNCNDTNTTHNSLLNVLVKNGYVMTTFVQCVTTDGDAH